MNNGNLQNDLEKITSYDEVRIYFFVDENDFTLYVNDNGYTYYSMNDLVSDCIELSKHCELKFI